MGICRGITDRIAAAHRRGCVGRCSLVPNGADFDHAVQVLRENSGLQAGVHLNLVEGRPISPPSVIPLLVNDRGYFRHTFFTLWFSHLVLRNRRAALIHQIETESNAQIARVSDHVDSWSRHLDSHRYVHLLPFITEPLIRLAESWSIEEIRIIREPHSSGVWRHGHKLVSPISHLKRCLRDLLSRRMIRGLRGKGIIYPDITWGLARARMSSIVAVGWMLRSLKLRRRKPAGWKRCELVFHPGPADSNDRRVWDSFPRYRSFYFSPDRRRE